MKEYPNNTPNGPNYGVHLTTLDRTRIIHDKVTIITLIIVVCYLKRREDEGEGITETDLSSNRKTRGRGRERELFRVTYGS